MILKRCLIVIVLLAPYWSIFAKPTNIVVLEQAVHHHSPTTLRHLHSLDHYKFHLVTNQNTADYVLTLYPKITITPLNYNARSKKNTILHKITAKLTIINQKTNVECTEHLNAQILHIYPSNSKFDEDLLSSKTRHTLRNKIHNSLIKRLNHKLIEACKWDDSTQSV